MVFPPASWAPRFAASMMPGPPPVVTTKRWRLAGIWVDHSVSRPLWYPPLSLPVAAVSLRKYMRNRTAALRFSRLAGWYRQGVARLRGNWAGNGVAGEEFSDHAHAFERDFNST